MTLAISEVAASVISEQVERAQAVVYSGENTAEAARQAGLATAQRVLAEAAANVADTTVSAVGAASGPASLFPDPWFRWSANNPAAKAGTQAIYSETLLTNRTWNASFEHPFGKGAWEYNSASSAAMGFNVLWDMPGADEYGIAAGDVISIGALVVADAGTVTIYGYDFSAIFPTVGSYTVTGGNFYGSANVAMDGTPKVLKIENHTVRAGSIGIAPYLEDNAASNFRVLAVWLIKGDKAYSRPPVRKTDFEQRKTVEMTPSVGDLAVAAGKAANLSSRLLGTVRPSGAPALFTFGAETLRRRAQKLGILERGVGTVLVEAFIGDSWTANDGYWLQMHTERMVAQWGDAGAGWIGFGLNGGTACQGNARSDIYGAAVNALGGWTSEYSVSTTNSPSLSNLKSSTAADKLTIVAADRNATGKLPTVAPATARLFWEGTANGVIKYRWFDTNAGTWGAYTTINVQGSGNQSALLVGAGMPTTSPRWQLEIEVVSGSVDLQGVDIRGTAPGYIAHKLGSSGSTAEVWFGQDATNWNASIASLGPDVAYLMWGTNESVAGQDPAYFGTLVQAMGVRCRAAMPRIDLCLMVPCENTPANLYPMANYADTAAAKALLLGACFIDLQTAFGLIPSEYDNASARPLLGADGRHPVGATQASTIPDAMRRAVGVKLP